MRLVELSHVVTAGMTTYPGLPGPVIEDHLSFEDSAEHYDAGTEFSIARITMVANTGTYLDTPAHRYRQGHDLAGLPLERCAHLPARVVPTSGSVIDVESLPDTGLEGVAVLLHTGWDQHWGTERYGEAEHPYLTESAATHLADREVALVGIDSVNIDDTVGGLRPAHSVLLGRGIPVVEHLTNLRELPETGAVFTAAPPAIAGMATFPVRAFAAVP